MPTPPKKNTIVTLYVNTAFPGLSQNNIEDHVWMADSNGDIVNNNAGRIANYTTDIIKNGNVTWVPAVINIRTDPSDYVFITDVVISSSNSNKMQISPEPTSSQSGNTTHVNGRANGDPGDILTYTIYFQVSHVEGGVRQPPLALNVDPKMQMH